MLGTLAERKPRSLSYREHVQRAKRTALRNSQVGRSRNNPATELNKNSELFGVGEFSCPRGALNAKNAFPKGAKPNENILWNYTETGKYVAWQALNVGQFSSFDVHQKRRYSSSGIMPHSEWNPDNMRKLLSLDELEVMDRSRFNYTVNTFPALINTTEINDQKSRVNPGRIFPLRSSRFSRPSSSNLWDSSKLEVSSERQNSIGSSISLLSFDQRPQQRSMTKTDVSETSKDWVLDFRFDDVDADEGALRLSFLA
jgi:hypothetical protein